MRRLFQRVLHVFLGLRARDFDEILSSVSTIPHHSSSAYDSPSAEGGAKARPADDSVGDSEDGVGGGRGGGGADGRAGDRSGTDTAGGVGEVGVGGVLAGKRHFAEVAAEGGAEVGGSVGAGLTAKKQRLAAGAAAAAAAAAGGKKEGVAGEGESEVDWDGDLDQVGCSK